MTPQKQTDTLATAATAGVLAMALVLGAPGAPTAASALQAQSNLNSGGGLYIKTPMVIKMTSDVLLVDGTGGVPVFRSGTAECFTVGPHGDLQYQQKSGSPGNKVRACANGKHIPNATVRILGLDAKGNVVMTTSKGETFYLKPNGDMAFVK